MTITPAPTSAQQALIDSGLVERFLGGDEAAFNEIVEKYRSKVFSIALGLLRNRADAEEIVQDTFIRAYRGLARFRGDSSLATWLHRIAVNLSRNRYWYFFRRRRQDQLSLDHTVGDSDDGTFADLISSDAPDPATENARVEFSQLVAECMQELDTNYREILTLRNVLDLPYDQIARTLGIKQGTVKSRIARAREALRVRLAEKCPDFATETSNDNYFDAHRPSNYGRPVMAFA